MTTRRHFLKTAASVSLGFWGLHRFAACRQSETSIQALLADGFGPLVPDPEKVLDLPKGFSYRIFSRAGEKMSDGLFVPAAHDGMAAFPGPRELTILVRNHEVDSTASPRQGAFGRDNELLQGLDHNLIYDNGQRTPCLGGTTTLVYDTKGQKLQKHFLSLAGTARNCAGGPTPWNSWITCEETVETVNSVVKENHGYTFEVPATAEIGMTEPIPLKEMGRFKHEAIAVDPKSGIVYETEDTGDSLIYRYLPNIPGSLSAGGRLQALSVVEKPGLDTRNWQERMVRVGESMRVRWLDLENVDSPEDDLRLRGFTDGAAMFARGEGMWYGNDAIYFACTNGGSNLKGQIWRYVPGPYEGQAQEIRQPGTLELFIEPNNDSLVDSADNLTISPWGDLIVCEDGSGDQFLVGVTQEGKMYKFAHNAISSSEFAGVTFSPDGSTLFVNIQRDGLTLAITGPWQS